MRCAVVLIGLAAAGLSHPAHADSLVVNPASRGTWSVNGGGASQGIRIVIDNNDGPAAPRADSLVVYPGDGSTSWMNWGGIKRPYPAQMLPVAIPARSCQIVPVVTACKAVTINVPAGTYWTGRWAYRPFASGVYLAGDTPALVKPTLTTEQGQDKVRFTLGNNNAQTSYAYVWIEVAPGQDNLFSDYARVYANTYSAQLQSPPWTVFTGRVRIDELQRLRSPAAVQIDPGNKAVNVVSVPVTGGMVQAQFAPTSRFVLQNVNSLYCAAANNNDPPQGARVVQADCGADVRGDRDWHVGKTFGNVTTLQVSSTGRCMDLPNETRDFGAGVVVGQCTAHDSQRWYWTPNPADNTYTVVNANSGYCLDIEGGSRKEYVRLTQTTCTGSPSQKWRLVPKVPTWAQAAPLPRAYAASADFARVVLADGRVLIAGGKDPDTREPIRDAWLYDPTTNKWTAAAAMNGVQGSNNPAVLLRDGRVLIAGNAAAEIYEPATNRWSVTGGAGLDPANAVVLVDGRVLVVDTQRYALYDPRSGRASPPQAFGGWQFGASLTLLDSGQVFIAGRGSRTALLYDPVADRMKTIAHPADTGNHVATKLANGKVLLAGGLALDGSVLNTAEVFDPQAETFTRVASMVTPRSSASGSVAAAFNGNALVVDGRRADQLQLRSAEAYDPVRNIWWVVPAPAQAGYWSGFDNWSTLLALPDGRFVAMGANSSSGPTPPTVEIYAP